MMLSRPSSVGQNKSLDLLLEQAIVSLQPSLYRHLWCNHPDYLNIWTVSHFKRITQILQQQGGNGQSAALELLGYHLAGGVNLFL